MKTNYKRVVNDFKRGYQRGDRHPGIPAHILDKQQRKATDETAYRA